MACSKSRIVLLVLIFLFVISLIVFWLQLQSPCTSVKEMEASLKIKILPGGVAMVGLNADTENLAFGVASPGMTAARSINVQHSREASVAVRMEGELAPWTAISPAQFELDAGGAQQVSFEVDIPNYALPGTYQGKAVVCIKEK